MGSSGPVHDKLRKSPRQLYLLTNVKENKLSKYTSDTIYQIDLPRIIIDGADIKTNATFLVDFIKNRDIQSFLKKNRLKLTTLNSASLNRENYKKDVNISVIDNHLTINAEDITFNIPIPSQDEIEEDILFGIPISSQNIIYDMTFNSDMVLIEESWKRNHYRAFHPSAYDKEFEGLHISIFLNNNKIEKVCFGNLQGIGICKYNTEVILAKEEISAIAKNKSIDISYIYNSYLAGQIKLIKNLIF